MKNGKNEPKSLIMLITAMLIFGTVGTIRKMIPLPSPLIALCRGSIGALLLLAFSTVTGKHPFKNLRPKTALLLLLCLLGLFLCVGVPRIMDALAGYTMSSFVALYLC